jgi:hypothetical protein
MDFKGKEIIMNGSFLIPCAFRLGGEPYTVIVDDDYCNDDEVYGEADFTQRVITLCNRYNGKVLKKSTKEKTFFHELVHHILDNMGQDELNSNEQFVDDFANLLFEYEKSKK